MIDFMKDNMAASLSSMKKSIDPFGIFSSALEVQYSWLQHPDKLATQMVKFGEELGMINQTFFARVYGMPADDLIPSNRYDDRFKDSAWTEHPSYDLIKELYLLYTHWLEDAIYETPDLSDKERRKAAFWARQGLNTISPSNFFWTNPEAIRRFMETGGMSAVEGLKILVKDLNEGEISMVDKEKFDVGVNVATTPGNVVFRNDLLEVLQFSPSTEQVHEIPIVIVSPWINKYYILDLNKKKSLIHYLVSKGFTVFVTSWKNPDADMRDTSVEDYIFKGIAEIIRVAGEVSGSDQVHAVGYCIGGTMLSAYMAWMNAERKAKAKLPVAHWTLFTGLVDFINPGDIDVFVDEDIVGHLEKQMDKKGYLDGGEMAMSFRMLRSNSLIWNYVMQGYLFGEEPAPLDVLYWNSDTTRLPATMHSYYLREFYINNKLIEPGALNFAGRNIDLGKIKQPLYSVGAEQDHIAPWMETFKVCQHVSGPVNYTLATSGHILGIINPPVDPPKRKYWSGDATGATDAEAWRDGIEKVAGSWWEDWTQWLSGHCGEMVEARQPGSKEYPALEAAPGTYVRET